MVSTQPNPIGPGFIPNNLPLEVTEQCSPALQLCTCVLSAPDNWSWLHTQQSPTWSHETMFICASTVYMYFCNLSTELNVPPLVATSLLNHFEDFVKTPLSFNTSVTDPFSVPTDSHLQELSDPGTTWVSTHQSLTRSLFLPTPIYRNCRILEQPEFQHISHWPVLYSYRLPLIGTVGFWNNLRTNTLHIQQEFFWKSFNRWNTGSSNPLSYRNLSWSTTRAPTATSGSDWSTWPEPFHARSSWIWHVALGFSLIKTTLFCPRDYVNQTLFIFWTGMVTPSYTVIWLYTTNLSFFRRPWQDFPWRPSTADFQTSLHVPVRPTA